MTETVTQERMVSDLRSASRKVRALKEYTKLAGAAKTTLHRLAETSDRAAAYLSAPRQSDTRIEGACPDCGRAKAKSASDAANGLCPKWWAIRDEAADRDCRLYALNKSPTPEHVEGDVLSVGEMETRAWLHTLHMEHGQKSVTADLEEEHPFGESGEDFDPSYNVTSEPLVTLTSATTRIQRAERERNEALDRTAVAEVTGVARSVVSRQLQSVTVWDKETNTFARFIPASTIGEKPDAE